MLSRDRRGLGANTKLVLRSFHKTRAVFKGMQSQLKMVSGAEQTNPCLRKTSRDLVPESLDERAGEMLQPEIISLRL